MLTAKREGRTVSHSNHSAALTGARGTLMQCGCQMRHEIWVLHSHVKSAYDYARLIGLSRFRDEPMFGR